MFWLDKTDSRAGLSPLARGTRMGYLHTHREMRFIPAGAGNTFMDGLSRLSDAVYPRWRGEHIPIILSVTGVVGLSPLARGTRFYGLEIS